MADPFSEDFFQTVTNVQWGGTFYYISGGFRLNDDTMTYDVTFPFGTLRIVNGFTILANATAIPGKIKPPAHSDHFAMGQTGILDVRSASCVVFVRLPTDKKKFTRAVSCPHVIDGTAGIVKLVTGSELKYLTGSTDNPSDGAFEFPASAKLYDSARLGLHLEHTGNVAFDPVAKTVKFTGTG